MIFPTLTSETDIKVIILRSSGPQVYLRVICEIRDVNCVLQFL
jgi:hypothetical protein